MKEIFVRKRDREQKAEEIGWGENSLRTKKTYENKYKGLESLKIWEILEVWGFGKSWELEDLQSGRNESPKRFI